MKSTLSSHMGTSFNVEHNNRTIPVLHADAEYEKKHNYYYPENMSLQDAFDFLFGESFDEYNSKVRKDRYYDGTYLEKLTDKFDEEKAKIKQMQLAGAPISQIRKYRKAIKPAYEFIIGLGNADDNPQFCKNGDMQETAKQILQEYIEEFNQKNSNVFLFNGSIHTGERGSIHGHCDLVFFADNCKRGMKKQCSLTKALAQMGYVSDDEKNENGLRLNAITKWENEQRRILREKCKARGIEIVDGEHSKQHLATEEYQLRADQKKLKANRKMIDEQAGELLQFQDEFGAFIQNHKYGTEFEEHIENISLRAQKVLYDELISKNKKILADSWREFNEYTAGFFAEYKNNKTFLWNELQQARKTQRYNKKHLENLLYDITKGTDFLIVKLFKLIALFFVSLNNFRYDNEVEKLETANCILKQQAKEIMQQSQDVSAELRNKNVDSIATALVEYEKTLKNALILINNTIKEIRPQNIEIDR